MKDLWEIEFLYKKNDLVLNLDIHNWSRIVTQLPDIHWSSVGAQYGQSHWSACDFYLRDTLYPERNKEWIVPSINV